jgi:thiol-disulfide isomerase/thioredoxin
MYQSIPTPSAVFIRADGTIGSRSALGAQAIRSLVTEATTRTVPLAAAPNGNHPAPVRLPSRVGQPAPVIELPDLSGEEVNLETFRGEWTLLLFWNPGCGFCQRMQDDLKAWEADPPAGAPRLVVISTGTVEANAEMGLRAPVLLDHGFATGRAFGAGGTPSAVLIDAEEDRV